MLFPHLIAEKRSTSYAILLGVWAMVAVYAILHDQYVVGIAPEHFTIYHAPLWGIKSPRPLAAAYAFMASFSPGLLLGLACVVVTRVGAKPKIHKGFIFCGVGCVIILSELAAASVGYFVYRTHREIYPSSWYPDDSLPLMVTQSIQVTCYFSSALFSLVFLLIMILKRHALAKNIGLTKLTHPS